MKFFKNHGKGPEAVPYQELDGKIAVSIRVSSTDFDAMLKRGEIHAARFKEVGSENAPGVLSISNLKIV